MQEPRGADLLGQEALMPLDISLEAIENDFRMADRGGQVAELAMARAQVRATLLAAGGVMFDAPGIHLPGATKANEADHQGRHEAPTTTVTTDEDGSPNIVVAQGADVDVFTVPKVATWDDRVTAAAMLLDVEADSLRYFLQDNEEARDGYPEAPTEADAHAGEPVDDVDADFFAEARKARKK
jgi:hypothetical protein